MTLTPQELNAEFEHTIINRCGDLTQGMREPSKWEYSLAREEAFKHIEKLKKQNEPET